MDSLPTFPDDAPDSICVALMVPMDANEMALLQSHLSTYTARKVTRRNANLNLILAALAHAFRKISENQIAGNITDLYTLFTMARTRGWSSLLVFDSLSLLQLKGRTKPNQDTELQLVLLSEPPVAIGSGAPKSVFAKRVNLPLGFQLANPLNDEPLDPPSHDLLLDQDFEHIIPAKYYFKRGFLIYPPDAPLLPEGFDDPSYDKWNNSSKIEPTIHECLDAKDVPAELQFTILDHVRNTPLDELSEAPAKIRAAPDAYLDAPPWVTLALPDNPIEFEKRLNEQVELFSAEFEKEYGTPSWVLSPPAIGRGPTTLPYIPDDKNSVSRWKTNKPATRRDFWRLFQLFAQEYERCRKKLEAKWGCENSDARCTHYRRAMGVVIPSLLMREVHIGIAKSFGLGKPVYVEWGFFCGAEVLTQLGEGPVLARTFDVNGDDNVGEYEFVCDPDGGFFGDG
ncbi:MAG: hypothetical protein M1831_001561 [Alyxoria varia]|nr:MAG: hypothetical protein M1831_001561 [Alyxoria varia]